MTYLATNHHPAALAHLHGLAAVVDPVTEREIAALGLPADATCWDVGAGNGHVSVMLATRFGARVMATDLIPDHIPEHPRIKTHQHDLRDMPWPDHLRGPYDLIVARLVLSHLRDRQGILTCLLSSLAPGGAILLQGWVPVPTPGVIRHAPDERTARSYLKLHRAQQFAFKTAGVDPAWNAQVHFELVSAGLADVQTRVHAEFWTGGGPGLQMTAAFAAQLRDALIDQGLTADEVDDIPRLTSDPFLVVHSPLLYSTSGRQVP